MGYSGVNISIASILGYINNRSGQLAYSLHAQSMAPPSKKQDRRTQRAGTSLAEMEVDDNDEDYQEKLQLLTDEHAKDKPKRKTVKNLMKTTFLGRRK